MEHHANVFLTNLAIVLCVAAVTTVVFQRLRQPVVLGYILAGLLVGPHVPFPLVADDEIIRGLSELGVILLLFTIGLEFTVEKLLRVGAAAAIVAAVEVSIQIILRDLPRRIFRWPPRESLFAGAARRGFRRVLFPLRVPRAALRLLGRARGVPGRNARRRVAARRVHRAPPPARARPLRRGVLRLGRNAHRPPPRAPALGGHPRPLRRGDRGQDGGSVDSGLSHRRRDPHLRRGQHEPGADRRILVHHRCGRDLDPHRAGLLLPGGGERLGAHHADYAVDDPRFRSRGSLGGSEVAARIADLRGAVRILDRRVASAGTAPDPRATARPPAAAGCGAPHGGGGALRARLFPPPPPAARARSRRSGG